MGWGQIGSPKLARLIAQAGLLATTVTMVALVCTHPSQVNLNDELGHLLISRDAWTRPVLIFNNWGRTVNTLAFMPVAPLPLCLARLWAAAMTVCVAFLAWRVALRFEIGLACLTPWLFLLQRQTLETGWMALTEVPFAVACLLAFWLALDGRWRLAGLVVGLVPLIRHEGVVLAAYFVLICLARRRWFPMLLAALPFVLNNVLAYGLFAYLPLRVFLRPKPTEIYGSGSMSLPLDQLIHSAGLQAFVLAVFGLVALVKNPSAMALLGGGTVYFLTHAILYRFGLFGSAGYDLFLAPLAPILAIMAAAGLDDVVRRSVPDSGFFRGRLRPAFSRGALVSLLLLPVLGSAVGAQMPTLLSSDAAIDEAIATLKRRQLDHQPVLSTHVRFYYHMPRPIPSATDLLWINGVNIDEVEPGTLALWDNQSSEDFYLSRKQLERPGSSWKKLWASVDSQAILYLKEAR